MKRRHIGFLLCFGVLAVQSSTVIATAADFTCQVYGGSFVFDDSDFKALETSATTREKFGSLELSSERRARICNTRKLWRLIKAGTATVCDFAAHYKPYDPQFFSPSELPAAAANKGYSDFMDGKKCSEKSN
jgi:hypothetical protein